MTSHAVPLVRPAGRERVLVQPVLEGLFLLTILTVTYHKLQWELAGSLTLSDVLTSVFLVLFFWDRFEKATAALQASCVRGDDRSSRSSSHSNAADPVGGGGGAASAGRSGGRRGTG